MTESTPLQSRKFLAYLVAEITWKVALLVVMVLGMKNGTIDLITGSIALAIVLVAGFVEAGYIIGQGSLDKYTRLAQIAVSNNKSMSMKGLTLTHHPETPPTNTEPTDPPVGG